MVLHFKDRAIELTNPSNSLPLVSAGIHVETKFQKSRLGNASPELASERSSEYRLELSKALQDGIHSSGNFLHFV